MPLHLHRKLRLSGKVTDSRSPPQIMAIAVTRGRLLPPCNHIRNDGITQQTSHQTSTQHSNEHSKSERKQRRTTNGKRQRQRRRRRRRVLYRLTLILLILASIVVDVVRRYTGFENILFNHYSLLHTVNTTLVSTCLCSTFLMRYLFIQHRL